MVARVLIIAGSDSGGGAGIQADIKTVTALGGYAATAITALTAQNTLGVQGIFPVDPAFIEDQIAAVLDDIGADCIKTGMLGDAAVITAVVKALEERAPDIPVVVDPVMVAKGGASLLAAEAVEVLKSRLLPRARLATPNIPEAEALLGEKIGGPQDMEAAALALLDLGPEAVLLKGGHLEGDLLVDLLVDRAGLIQRFEGARIESRHTHGTGCTLASACAEGLARGLALGPAVARARAYVRQAIATAPGLGGGHGPLNHGHTVGTFGDV
ncbi:MAG: bifunctional hydroxymethylpyrimidine kinase/phosphomethylpyrimidine kinase [Alphaproteobacteria bacterium]|nr:bifunctional hydroxymethylpyrimidine kinase/phosphomethylpyrimidine kinase [Alphaproteobacteria bacterium]